MIGVINAEALPEILGTPRIVARQHIPGLEDINIIMLSERENGRYPVHLRDLDVKAGILLTLSQ